MTEIIIQTSEIISECGSTETLQEAAINDIAKNQDRSVSTLEKPSVYRGMHIRKNNTDFRVIHTSPAIVTLCTINVDFIDIHYEKVIDIIEGIIAGDILEISETPVIIDSRQIPERFHNIFEIRREIIRCVENEYGPTYIELSCKTKKEVLDDLAKKYDISRKSIDRLIRNYLQSGLTEASIVDQRWMKRGAKRPVKEKSCVSIEKVNKWIQPFNDAISQYKKSKGNMSLQQVYDIMCINHFSTVIFDGNHTSVSESEKKPSFWQFFRYYEKTVSPEERDKIRMGEKQQRNNKRILHGTSDSDVEGCYDRCEMDAWEVNVSLVDEDDPERVVSNPILYMIKDVATRMIVAASIAFDNNSIVGCLNCIANLNEDKRTLLTKYGITEFEEETWLTGYQPRSLLADNGSDFISNELFRIMNELNIIELIAEPGMGSRKAIIERSFGDIHKRFAGFWTRHGHITKDHDSNHHKEAVLNIKEFTKMFFQEIIDYNKTPHQGISISRDMSKKKVSPVPYLVMQYYAPDKNARNLPQGDEFLRILLKKDKAKYDRRGVLYCNLYYRNDEDSELMAMMYSAQNKKLSIDVLVDERNMNLLYYVKNGRLMRAHINLDYKKQNTFLNMTKKEVEDMFADNRRAMKEAKLASRADHLVHLVNQAVLMDEAIKNKPNYNSIKNIRENREAAKQKTSFSHNLETKFGVKKDVIDVQALPEPEETAPFTLVHRDYSEIEDPAERLKQINMEMYEDYE